MAKFETVAGGFKLNPQEQILVNQQRAITKRINDQFIQVGAMFLKQASKNPTDDDWAKRAYRDTDLQLWIDDTDLAYANVGFNLQFGWVDFDIDSEDPDFNACVIAALDFLRVDTRFRFGRKSVGYPSHVMVQLGEEESASWEMLTKFEPREMRIAGKRFHVQLRSIQTNIKAENLERTKKQTVMPGSIYLHKKIGGAHDVSVWYTKDGKPAENAAAVAATTPRRVNFNELVRAITFGTMLYVVKDHWIEGSRQTTAHKVCGWLARVVSESAAINNHESIAKDVFCPVDSDDTAEALIHFICEFMGDSEAHMRVRAYNDAREKLERNPDARIPGWPAIDQLLGADCTLALRTVFMPGSDVSLLTKMADRYVYDETDNQYIDRERFWSNGPYIHMSDQLALRHKGDVVMVGGKPKEAFKLFEASNLRKRVGFRDLYPALDPGGLFRISGLGEIMGDDDDADQTSLVTFNTWRGWPVEPAANPDSGLLRELVERLDRLLGYMTRDNAEQIDWMKKWVAYIFQNPGHKQQIAPVCVGGQGVGKSFFGNIFMKAIMGSQLWGTASPKILEGDFSIGPFKDKMFVFIDEAKFHSEAATDEVKKLIRGIDVPGVEKFQEARNYRLFARLMFASNRLDMNVGQANTRDRALFYTKAYDKDHLGLDEMSFRLWAEELKPWFDEFDALLARRDVREHYMHYFLNVVKASRHEVESIKHSSSGDSTIVLSNMSWARRIAKYIIEDGRVYEDLDITYPFTLPDLFKRVSELSRELGFSNVQGARVLAEFDEAGVLEKVRVSGQIKLRFRYKLGELTNVFGKAIGAPLEPRYAFDENEDFGPNDCDGSKRPEWRGAKRGVVAQSKGY